MLIATQAQSVSGTQRYFDETLTRGDYYLGQEVSGHWRGKGAALLGLGRDQAVTREQFGRLLAGKHPITGKTLTQRQRADRRPGVDLTFSVPKSVSIAWAVGGDDRIIKMLQEAVHETMRRDIEPLMHRRVRSGKHAWSRQKTRTGKLIYADFLHKTSRPVEGHPDPHLHIHAFVMNWTEHEGKSYAAELEEIVRQRPSLQAKFEARLARKLRYELGYKVDAVRFQQGGRIKRGWELTGIGRELVERFSRRTSQVEEHAAAHGIVDAEAKGRLGKLTREKKDTERDVVSLRQDWVARVSAEELGRISKLRGQASRESGGSESEMAVRAVEHALDHHLFRQSTVERHAVVGTALEFAVSLSPEQIEQALNQKRGVIERSVISDGSERPTLTTREVLDAEKQMILFAREGRGTRKAIAKIAIEFELEWLNEQQKAAVRHVLESRDAVMVVTGGAGTGKSSLMMEAAQGIQKSGREVYSFAPSTGARDVLKEKGFTQAQTVEYLLRNTKMQESLRDQVIWIDEAGLLDVRSMNGIFEIAKSQNARVVLSGDTRQHASPRRGEALRLLEEKAGLKAARVEAIQRQSGAYKEVVALISRGHGVVEHETGKSGLLAGFDRLDAMGKIREIDPESKDIQLAAAYLQAFDEGKTTLVVAPTHAEAARVTEQIREGLKRSGHLNGEEREFTQMRSLNLSEAEKREAAIYADKKGMLVQFHQNVAGGIKRGERYRIETVLGDSVHLISAGGDGKRATLPLKAPDRFEVYGEERVALTAGDKIRLSLGGVTKNGQRNVANGRLDEIKGFNREGHIVLKNGWVLDKSYGHIDRGYVITSHAAQGKDRQVAIAAMGSESLPAINAKQFYVTVSRGSEDVMIFVDSKSKVRRAIERAGQQLSASELVHGAEPSSTAEAGDDRSGPYELEASQRGWRTYRDRVMRWWRGQDRENGRDQALGRHRERQAEVRDGFNMSSGLGDKRSWEM